MSVSVVLNINETYIDCQHIITANWTDSSWSSHLLSPCLKTFFSVSNQPAGRLPHLLPFTGAAAPPFPLPCIMQLTRRRAVGAGATTVNTLEHRNAHKGLTGSNTLPSSTPPSNGLSQGFT